MARIILVGVGNEGDLSDLTTVECISTSPPPTRIVEQYRVWTFLLEAYGCIAIYHVFMNNYDALQELLGWN
jgi:hypothetical protein